MKSLLITLASAHAGWALGTAMRGDEIWHVPWFISMMFVCTLVNIHSKEGKS